jgi:hypothetical protein
MSALGQNQTSERFHAMSALPPKADIRLAGRETDWASFTDFIIRLGARTRFHKSNQYAMLFRRPGLFERWLYSAHFGMQIWSCRYGHGVTTLGIGLGIPHDGEHVIERQNACRLGGGASFGGRTIARTLLSSTGFAADCHGIYRSNLDRF